MDTEKHNYSHLRTMLNENGELVTVQIEAGEGIEITTQQIAELPQATDETPSPD